MFTGIKAGTFNLLLIVIFFSMSTLAQQKQEPCWAQHNLLMDKEEKPVRLSSAQLKKRTIHCEVPKLSGAIDAKATVIVEVLVTPEGKVKCARMINTVHPIIDKAATEAAGKWTFKPYIVSGGAVTVSGFLTIYVSWDREEARKTCARE